MHCGRERQLGYQVGNRTSFPAHRTMDLLPITIFLIIAVVGSCFWITMLDLAFYRSSVVCPFLEKCGLKIERDEFQKLFSMWDIFVMRREMEVLRQMASHD